MDRLSTDANILPCLRAANPRLASATEGAAENKPAKLFGFKASPKPANKQTAAPPIKNRSTHCMAAVSFDRIASRSRLQRTEAFALLRRRGSFHKCDVHRIDIATGQAISVSFVAVGLVYFVFRGKFLAFLLIARNECY